jgi:hypothetical protein
MIESFLLDWFPPEVRSFWEAHYVRYAPAVFVPGTRVTALPDAPATIEVIVPGEYEWHPEPGSGSDWLRDRPEEVPCIIRYGQKGAITVNGQVYDQQEMPGVKELSDFEITNILNYINQAWGNTYGDVSYPMVKSALEDCAIR